MAKVPKYYQMEIKEIGQSVKRLPIYGNKGKGKVPKLTQNGKHGTVC